MPFANLDGEEREGKPWMAESRRRHARLRTQGEVVVSFSGIRVVGRVTNVSQGGVYVSFERAPIDPFNIEVDLLFEERAGEPPFEVTGRIAHLGTTGIGIALDASGDGVQVLEWATGLRWYL
jgi:hypothetical protein